MTGSTPYPGMSAEEVMRKIKDGYRLEKPDYCKREVSPVTNNGSNQLYVLSRISSKIASVFSKYKQFLIYRKILCIKSII